jgi:hypothetical protein
MQIIIQPIEKDIDNNILKLLSDSISPEFNNVHDVIVAPTLKVDFKTLLAEEKIRLGSLIYYIGF